MMQTLIAWLDQSKIARNPSALQYFCELAGEPELKQEITLLETSLYAVKHNCQWSGDKLL